MSGFLSFEELLEFFDRNRGKRYLLTFHTVGDRDGVGAAIALSQMLPNSVIATPDFITNNAKRMVEQSGYKGDILSRIPGDIDVVVVLDANRLEILGKFRKQLLKFSGQILFIDHHGLPEDPEYGNRTSIFNSEAYNSASSIVCDILNAKRVKIGKEAAFVLINGIVADSADFQNSNALAFQQISQLLGITGLLYSEIISNSHAASSANIRNRIMRDLFSSKIEVCGEYLIISGEAQFQANTAAETALRMGADASLFWSIRDKEVSMSGRLRSPLDRELSINLGALLDEAGHTIGGTGGGHPCAAGAYGKKKEGLDGAVRHVIDGIKKGFLRA